VMWGDSCPTCDVGLQLLVMWGDSCLCCGVTAVLLVVWGDSCNFYMKCVDQLVEEVVLEACVGRLCKSEFPNQYYTHTHVHTRVSTYMYTNMRTHT